MQFNTGDIVVTNVETVPGKVMTQHFGLVCGSTVKAKHIGSDLLAGLKNVVGGELGSYTDLLNEARNQAMERMLDQARQLGANAIVNVRFSTSSVAQGAAEIYVYGTAIRAESRPQQSSPQPTAQAARQPQQAPQTLQPPRPNPINRPQQPPQ